MKGTIGNGLDSIIAQAIEEMKAEQGTSFHLEHLNLAELERRTGISRARLRRLQKSGFVSQPHGRIGHKAAATVLTGYTGLLDELLKSGVSNSSVCYDRLTTMGYTGSLSTVKDYIAKHKHLIPAKRQLVAPQGNRGRRFTTEPGETFQMDWGFTKVLDYSGREFQAACFAMICHHCGQRYIEFFPNAKQENLFIGMIHAFRYMGIPRYVLTDNMKSVVVCRDINGIPVWQKDYEAFMQTVGYQTKLCRPRHPFTKGKVERLVRFVKDNFLTDRVFFNISDLNLAALDWCNQQNRIYHRALGLVPQNEHFQVCAGNLSALEDTPSLRAYLCPVRKITFDGFVNYEGRRFGVPYSYRESSARVMREGEMLYVYSLDLRFLLATHEVTWSKRDKYCPDQFLETAQPEEFPTAPVKTTAKMLETPNPGLSFEKFNFDREVDWDE